MYLIETELKDLVELTRWAQQYLIVNKQQLGIKRKTIVQPKRAERRKPTQSKPDRTPEVARVLQMPWLWPHTIGMLDQRQSWQGLNGFDTC